jgi:hypothetical protein
MKFTFATWNVNNRKLTSEHISRLREADCDLLAIQKAPRAFHADLENAGLFEWSVTSLDLLPHKPEDGESRRLGCSIFGRKPFQLVSSGLLGGLEVPDRALMARTLLSSRELTVYSLDATGSSRGSVTRQAVKYMTRWLVGESGSILLGIGANAPKTDRPYQGENEWGCAEEPLLLGATPWHQLKDAFRILLKQQPDLLDEVLSERPQGPLAISHYRGRGAERTPCRNDFVFISPDMVVREMNHTLYETLSDHALVAAQLELPESEQDGSGQLGIRLGHDNVEDDILMNCALRFDGWQYEIDTGLYNNAGLQSLVEPILEGRRFHSDPNDNLAAFFGIQRYLYKWGGDRLAPHSREHVAFRLLFLDVYRYEIPEKYRNEPYWQEWEDAYRPRQEHYAAIIRETFQRKGRGPTFFE